MTALLSAVALGCALSKPKPELLIESKEWLAFREWWSMFETPSPEEMGVKPQ